LSLAGSLLWDIRGETRIVVFTDGRFRKDLERELAARTDLQVGRAIVHVVDVSLGETERYVLARREGGVLAELAARTGGMHVDVQGAPGTPSEEAARALVRPVQVDQLRLRIDGKEQRIVADRDDVLGEGQAVRYFTLVDKVPSEIELVGKIWGRSWSQPVRRDAGLSAALPALVFGDSLWESLDGDEQARAARVSGVVSPVTSWVLSPEGAPENRLTLWGSERSGSGFFGGGIHCPPLFFRRDMDVPGRAVDESIAKDLRPQVFACAAHHGLDSFAAEVSIETTGNEIVDVSVASESAEFSTCVADAIWGVELDASAFAAGGPAQVVLQFTD
jgi:hypothetical protein